MKLFNFRRKRSATQNEEKPQPFFSQSNDTSVQKKEGPFFQTKLKVGKPGDQYEQEADAMANQVVSNISSDSAIQKEEADTIQKVGKEEEEPLQMMGKEEEEPLQMMGEEEEEPLQAMAEEEEEPVQMKAENQGESKKKPTR